MSAAQIKLAALDIGDSIWGAAKSIAKGAKDVAVWTGGALAGEFNTKATVGQIVVDAAISMFPVAGEVTAARDATAIIIRMNESEEAAHNTWEWISLVLCLIAVIPVVGGVVKGVGRLVMRAASKSEKLLHLANEILSFLRKMGYGDAHKFLKALDFAKYQSDVIKALGKMTGYISKASQFAVKRMGHLLPAGVKATLNAMPAKLAKLQSLGEKMIPKAIKELNENLNKVRKALVDGSYIAPITVGPKTSKAMVAEARLAEFATKGKSAGHTPATAMARKEGWPEIAKLNRDRTTGKSFVEGQITTFSAKNPPVAVTHKPGQKMVRVVNTEKLGREFEIAGRFWTDHLPKNGTDWRTKCAVKHDWSLNGHYAEMVIPTKEQLKAAGIKVPHDWEGMRLWKGGIAEQMDDAGANATRRLFEGGDIQYFVDFHHPHNAPILEWMRSKVHAKPTGWPDKILPTEKEAQAVLLGQTERSAKIQQQGHVLRGGATVGKQSNNQEGGK